MDAVELMSAAECADKVDRPLLLKQLRYVFGASSFYREKYGREGIADAHLADPAFFEKLPFTEKKEILHDQDSYPPYGRLATQGKEELHRRVHMTSGSTGRPLYVIMTENDLAATVEAGRRAFLCAGLTAQDTVVHCLNYRLWAGGVTDHLNLEATGATVIPFGVGNTKDLIQTILQLRPTAISCTPSYLSRLEVVLRDEFRMSPPALGLRKALLGGEGGLQNPAVRLRIEDAWHIRAIDANYGMADVLSIFGAECEVRSGLHFHGQGIIHIELIDPMTGTHIPLEGGRTGEMVITNLTREAQPLIRYRTKDIISIVSTDACACGRSSFRFVVSGRSDDMITVRGINVYPNALAAIFAKHPEWFSGEYEVVLDSPPPVEHPLLRVELASAGDSIDPTLLERYIINSCRQEYHFTPRVTCIGHGQFPRTEGKTRRLRKVY